MAMFMMPTTIPKIANIAILAIMATIVMANGNFSMAIMGIQLKSIQKMLILCG